MLSFYKKYYKTAFDIALIIVTVLLFMWIASYLYRIAAPVFLSFFIFLIIEPLAKFLHRRGMRKTIATAISVLIFALIILAIIVGAGAIFISQINRLVDVQLDTYRITFQSEITQNIDYLQNQLNTLPEGWAEKIQEYATAIAAYGASFAKQFLSWLVGFLGTFSGFMVNFSIGIILAYFLSVEIELWKRLAREKSPKTFKTAFFFLKENVLKGILGYLKAQLKLVSISFVIIYASLLILGVNNSFSVSVLAAVFDVLPLLGVSAVFVSWIIYLFFVGNSYLAFWLIGVLVVVLGVRQILEPKITGDSLGVSAYTMLVFMIVSLSLFGIAGVILSPILIILIKALYDQGYLQRWIRRPEDY